jgi:hypothetical protein
MGEEERQCADDGTGVCSTQHCWRIGGQDAGDGELPGRLQTKRRRHTLQLVHWIQDVHDPGTRGVHVLGGGVM